MTGELVRFLFVPEGLSLVFVPLMLLLVARGLFSAYELWLRVSKEVDEASDAYLQHEAGLFRKIAPSPYLQMAMGPRLQLLGFIDAVPALLVTLGILGTFIGLGVAVGQAAIAMSSGEDVNAALRSLLNTISFKFQSSAWGIMLSLVFTVLVKLRIDAYVSRVVEECSLRLLRDAYDPDGVGTFVQAADEVAAAANRMAGLSGDIGEALERIREELEASGNRQAESIQKSLARMNAAMGSASESQERAGEALRESLAGMKEAVQEAIGESNEVQVRVGRAISTLNESVKVLDRTQAEFRTELGSLTSVHAGLAGPAGKIAMHLMEEGERVTPKDLQQLAATLEVLAHRMVSDLKAPLGSDE